MTGIINQHEASERGQALWYILNTIAQDIRLSLDDLTHEDIRALADCLYQLTYFVGTEVGRRNDLVQAASVAQHNGNEA